jgi:hypothetical protein
VRLVIDGDELFGSAGVSIDDLVSDAVYDLDSTGNEGVGVMHSLLAGAHNTFHWKSPMNIPVAYSASVDILIARDTGAATKKFKAGLIILTKET